MIGATTDNLADAGIGHHLGGDPCRCGVLLRRQPGTRHRHEGQRFGRNGSDKTQRTGTRCPERADPQGRYRTRADATKATHQAWAGRLRQTQGHRRACLRSDEGSPRCRASPTPRDRRGTRRMDTPRHLLQPEKARQRCRWSTAPGVVTRRCVVVSVSQHPFIPTCGPIPSTHGATGHKHLRPAV